mmetsp:Transcript_16970/g.57088  ORF Transcript_16970/g.57088 Transcript_16970/m.57088 type:complete len:200 (+) Transcript_16970:263-862(+)
MERCQLRLRNRLLRRGGRRGGLGSRNLGLALQSGRGGGGGRLGLRPRHRRLLLSLGGCQLGCGRRSGCLSSLGLRVRRYGDRVVDCLPRRLFRLRRSRLCHRPHLLGLRRRPLRRLPRRCRSLEARPQRLGLGPRPLRLHLRLRRRFLCRCSRSLRLGGEGGGLGPCRLYGVLRLRRRLLRRPPRRGLVLEIGPKRLGL